MATLARTILMLLCFMASRQLLAADPSSTGQVQFGARAMKYEVFPAPDNVAVILLLHGHSGPANYRSQAVWFQKHGFTVLLPHYTDMGRWSGPPHEDEAFQRWIAALRALIRDLRSSDPQVRHIALVGYSQAASLALAAGSQAVPVDAIAEWYGSLPDTYFAKRGRMPPLLILHGRLDTVIPVANAQQLMRLCALDGIPCASHIYPNAGHGLIGRSLDTADLADADERTAAFLRQQFAAAGQR